MFVDADFRASAEYREFWQRLNAGEYLAGQYRRIGKGGKEIWLEASYNPILDLNGRPYKVIKYATDITKQVGLLSELKTLIDRNFGEIDQAVALLNQQSGDALRTTATPRPTSRWWRRAPRSWRRRSARSRPTW